MTGKDKKRERSSVAEASDAEQQQSSSKRAAVGSDGTTTAWWKDRLDEDTRMVYLKFPESGEHDIPLVPISVKELEQLFKELECLPLLLFGHPQMQAKTLKKHEGFHVLEMPATMTQTAYGE